MEDRVPSDFEFEALQEARNYRNAIVRELSPFLGESVIEIGAGIGQISQELYGVAGVKNLLAVEPEPSFHAAYLNKPWKLLKGTSRDVAPSKNWSSAVLVNVLEHIEDDMEELLWLRKLVSATQGHVCVLVPARPEIYAPIDKDFGHFRRYTKRELREKFSEAGLEVKQCYYFNWAGYFAWALSMKILRQRRFSKGSVRFYDRHIFPMVYKMESRLARPPIGQSLIAIGQARHP